MSALQSSQSLKEPVLLRGLVWLARSLALWAGLVFLFATQFVLVGSFSWKDAFFHAATFWAQWVIFMPVAIWVAFRFPLERKKLNRQLAIHVLSCGLIVGASQVLSRHVLPEPPPPADAQAPGPGHAPAERQNPNSFHQGHRPNGFFAMRAGVDTLIYGSILSVCQALVSFRRSEQRERRTMELEARLARSKLQALRMQINPHFLFNTLNAVSTLIHVNPHAADEMIGDLSDLLRSSLESSDEQEVPLKRELDFIRHYVGIERKRFGERLRVEEAVPEELRGALIPALVLQPLVENSIRHGIEPQKEPGLISIQARREGESLLLVVQDNGRGLAARPQAKPARQGIGLANTQARLRELYGPRHEFAVSEVQPHGCRVQIRLPFHTQAASSSTVPLAPASAA